MRVPIGVVQNHKKGLKKAMKLLAKTSLTSEERNCIDREIFPVFVWLKSIESSAVVELKIE